MLALEGIYENGVIKLERPLRADKPIRVIVTFLEEVNDTQKKLSLQDFSFLKTRSRLKKYTFSLSEAVIEERREE